MNVSILLLKTGETLISVTSELPMEPKVHLIEPYILGGKTKVTMTKWIPYTDDKDVLLVTDTLLTIVSPTDDLTEKYLKKIGKTLEDLDTGDDESSKVMLNEDELVPEGSDMGEVEFDEYEPRYLES